MENLQSAIVTVHGNNFSIIEGILKDHLSKSRDISSLSFYVGSFKGSFFVATSRGVIDEFGRFLTLVEQEAFNPVHFLSQRTIPSVFYLTKPRSFDAVRCQFLVNRDNVPNLE